MDAALVRAFLAATDDRPPDGSAIARVRAALEILGRPDIRYLVATLRGPGGRIVARYARRILEAAGAPTATSDDPLGEALFGLVGTEVASAAYSLGASRSELGEPSRRELELLIGLTAAAAASRRVLLLVDEDPVGDPVLVDAVAADVVRLGGPDEEIASALGDFPAGRPVVVGPLDDPEVAARIGRIGTDRGLALVQAGREFSVVRRDGALDVIVAGETYAGLISASGHDPWLVAAGIATALAVGLLGIRMRPEWVVRGVSAAAAE